MVKLGSLRPEAWIPGTSGRDHGEVRARASLPQLPGRVIPGVLWLRFSTSPPPARDAAPPTPSCHPGSPAAAECARGGAAESPQVRAIANSLLE